MKTARRILVTLLVAAGLILASGPLRPTFAEIIYSADLVNNSCLATNVNYDLTLDDIDGLSIQVIYSSTSLSSKTFLDGKKSTATITVSSNTSLVGGKLAIYTVRLDEGNQWTAMTTASGTAKSISDAIMANSTLSSIITATWSSAGVVSATSNVVGTNPYTLYTSTNAALRLNGSASNNSDIFLNGSESNVDLTTDLITVTGHGFGTGVAILYSTTALTGITGLVNQTTYYIIRNDYDRIQLASSLTNAIAGTEINMSAQTGGGTYTLTPIGISGTFTSKLQGGNDGTNFSDLYIDLNQCSISFASPFTASFIVWDLGQVYFKFLRLVHTTGTWGCINLRGLVNGKK